MDNYREQIDAMLQECSPEQLKRIRAFVRGYCGQQDKESNKKPPVRAANH